MKQVVTTSIVNSAADTLQQIADYNDSEPNRAALGVQSEFETQTQTIKGGFQSDTLINYPPSLLLSATLQADEIHDQLILTPEQAALLKSIQNEQRSLYFVLYQLQQLQHNPDPFTRGINVLEKLQANVQAPLVHTMLRAVTFSMASANQRRHVRLAETLSGVNASKGFEFQLFIQSLRHTFLDRATQHGRVVTSAELLLHNSVVQHQAKIMTLIEQFMQNENIPLPNDPKERERYLAYIASSVMEQRSLRYSQMIQLHADERYIEIKRAPHTRTRA